MVTSKKWRAFERDGGACGRFEHLTESGLVLDIFSWLELEDLFRIRLVCKSWYDAVLSPRLARLFMERHQLDPWILLKARTEIPPVSYRPRPSDYDPYVHHDFFDHNMKLASHQELWRPYTPNQRKKCSLPLGPPGLVFVALCASNGLVCGRLMDDKHPLTLSVGNPFTNQWKILPPAPIAREKEPYLRTGISMERDPKTGFYVIIVCYIRLVLVEEYSSDEEYDGAVYVVQYDSATGVWETGTSLSGTPCSASPGQGSLIYMEAVDGVSGVIRYDPVCREWWNCNIGLPVYGDWNVSHLGAFMYKGKCVWVAALSAVTEEGEEMGVAVWELDEKRRCWTLLSKIFWKELYMYLYICNLTFGGLTDRRMRVVGDTVVISLLYRRGARYVDWPPVAYDLVSSRWYTSVEPEEFEEYLECGEPRLECSYALVPSLTAQP